MSKLKTVYVNPWKESTQVNGTDGNQFHPIIQSDERLVAFVPDFARSVDFVYRDSQFDAYQCGRSNSIEMMNFYLSDEIMQNQQKNSKNVNYDTVYDGTVNLATVMRAPAIGSKGHYLQIDKNLTDRLATIVDAENNTVQPDAATDDTWLGIEKYSGVTLQARERIMISFIFETNQTSNTSLFAHLDHGYVVPFLFVQRDAIMTNEQVSDILGQLILLSRVRIPCLIVLVILGMVMVATGGCLIKR